MTRPRKIYSTTILRSLSKRPYIRYTPTSTGVKALAEGKLDGPMHQALDSLIESTQANNDQPVSLIIWRKFHEPRKLKNEELQTLVMNHFISIVARSKSSYALAGRQKE